MSIKSLFTQGLDTELSNIITLGIPSYPQYQYNVIYDFDGIPSEEAFGSFWYYKTDKQVSEQLGGGGGPSKIITTNEPRKRAPDLLKHKQIFVISVIESEERFGDIEVTEYFNIQPIRTSNKFWNISHKRHTLEDEEALILMLLAA